jgi:fatty-acyl-CoA synthase
MSMATDGLSYWQAETEGINLLEMTIGDLLDRRADELATQEAVVYSCYPEFDDMLSIRWTYQDYRDRANAVAKGLLALGLAKGDHIAVWAANLPQWLLLDMAAAKAGLVLVTINPLLQAAEAEYILKQGDVQALFFMAQVRTYDHLVTVRSLITPGARSGEVTSERLPKLRFVCLMGMHPPGLLIQQGWRPALLDEVIAQGSQVSDELLSRRQSAVTPLDPTMIVYTSGTTGSPKGAILTHRGLLNNAWLMARQWRLGQTDRYCTPMPFFHVGGCVGGILAALAAGCAFHPLLAFDPVKLLQINSRERCTFSGGAPTMLLAVLQHSDFEQYDLSSLKQMLCGGAPVPVAMMQQIHARIGAEPTIVYAQTEASCAMTQTLPDDPFERKAASCGVPLPHTEIKIADPATGKTVPRGERGEICTRGYLVMAGYYKMPEKTARAIDPEGWLHTGDLATMDASGHVNIVGRVRDMVIRGGENLFPAEIEAILIRHPKVANVQVVGVPDAFFGEELLAVVISGAAEPLTEQELREYCQGQMSHQKIPRYFQFVESYPMTASGKIQKFVLREQAIKDFGLEEAAQTKTA